MVAEQITEATTNRQYGFLPWIYSENNEQPITTGSHYDYDERLEFVTLAPSKRYLKRVIGEIETDCFSTVGTHFIPLKIDELVNSRFKFVFSEIEKLSTPMVLESEVLPEYFQENKQTLIDAYSSEAKKYKTYLKGKEDFVLEMFNNLSNNVSQLEFQHSAVELTDNESVKMTLLFPVNKILMLSQSFADPENLNRGKIMYSFFLNRELIASDVTTIEEFVKNFKRYLSL